MKPGEDPGMEETSAGSGKQNKSTRGGNSLLVTEGAEGLNGAFPREHHRGKRSQKWFLISQMEMVPYFPFVAWDQVWIFPGKPNELDALLVA